MGSFEYNHHDLVANQLERVERSMDRADSLTNSGLEACNMMQQQNNYNNSTQSLTPRVYPTKMTDRAHLRTSTTRSMSRGSQRDLGTQSGYASDAASPRSARSSRSVRFADSRNRSATPVWDRLLSTSLARDEEIARRRQLADEYRELNIFSGCTFQPRINDVTDKRSAKKTLADGEAHNRLYNDGVRLRQKKEETIKAAAAKRDKERDQMLNSFKASKAGEDSTHSNASKFWDRLYQKPEKKPFTEAPKPKKNSAFDPEKAKKGLAASLRLYKTAGQIEQNKQELIRRSIAERDAKLAREIAAAGLHPIHNHRPMSGSNTPMRVSSPSPTGRMALRPASRPTDCLRMPPTNPCPAPRPPQRNDDMNNATFNNNLNSTMLMPSEQPTMNTPRKAADRLRDILSGGDDGTPLNSSRAKCPTPPPELVSEEPSFEPLNTNSANLSVPQKRSEESDEISLYEIPDDAAESVVTTPEKTASDEKPSFSNISQSNLIALSLSD